MKSETNNNLDVQMRSGSVTKEAHLCFSRETGGDLLIEPGDLVVLTVIRKGSKEMR